MHRTLEALRNPTIFNGLAVLAAFGLGLKVLSTDAWPIPKIIFLAFCLLVIVAVTTWLNYFAWKNPRFLAYGPEQYLTESQLEHERLMADKVRV
jgi:hypothetical protein